MCLSRIRESGATLATPHVCPDGSIIPLCASPFLLGIQWNQGYGDIWTKIP